MPLFPSLRIISEDGNHSLDITEKKLLGRGDILGIHDKRISRQHTEIDFEDGVPTLTPLGLNPMYLKRNGKEVELKKGVSYPLMDKDVFTFCLDQYPFHVHIDNNNAQHVASPEGKGAFPSFPLEDTPMAEDPGLSPTTEKKAPQIVSPNLSPKIQIETPIKKNHVVEGDNNNDDKTVADNKSESKKQNNSLSAKIHAQLPNKKSPPAKVPEVGEGGWITLKKNKKNLVSEKEQEKEEEEPSKEEEMIIENSNNNNNKQQQSDKQQKKEPIIVNKEQNNNGQSKDINQKHSNHHSGDDEQQHSSNNNNSNNNSQSNKRKLLIQDESDEDAIIKDIVNNDKNIQQQKTPKVQKTFEDLFRNNTSPEKWTRKDESLLQKLNTELGQVDQEVLDGIRKSAEKALKTKSRIAQPLLDGDDEDDILSPTNIIAKKPITSLNNNKKPNNNEPSSTTNNNKSSNATINNNKNTTHNNNNVSMISLDSEDEYDALNSHSLEDDEELARKLQQQLDREEQQKKRLKEKQDEELARKLQEEFASDNSGSDDYSSKKQKKQTKYSNKSNSSSKKSNGKSTSRSRRPQRACARNKTYQDPFANEYDSGSDFEEVGNDSAGSASDDQQDSESNDTCPFGSECYRKNRDHIAKYHS